MGKVRSWEISDAFWERIEPLIPTPQRPPGLAYKRKPGAGRPPMNPRRVFEAIVYVLRTGIQWRALPKNVYGSASAVHTYFQKWSKAGVFTACWRAGLAECDELEGIAWTWLSIDGSQGKAPLAQESVGPNPTDRGKKWKQGESPGGRAWGPAVPRRVRGQSA